MSPIVLSIEGRPGRPGKADRSDREHGISGIDARALTLALSNFVAYLSDIDRGLSGNNRGTLDWIVTDMNLKRGSTSSRPGIQSLQCQLSPVARQTDKDFTREVTSLGVEGLQRVESEQGTPAYLSLEGMNQLRKMVGVIGRFGVTGMEVKGLGQEAALSARSAASITELIRPRRRSPGSIEGVLEMISVHKKPHFTLYSSVTKKAVSCNFVESEFLPVVKDSLGHRVSVSGVIHSNAKGEPLFVNVEKIRHLHSVQEIIESNSLGNFNDFNNLNNLGNLNNLNDLNSLGGLFGSSGFSGFSDLTLRGMQPGFTGGSSSEEYVEVGRRKNGAQHEYRKGEHG